MIDDRNFSVSHFKPAMVSVITRDPVSFSDYITERPKPYVVRFL